MTALNPYSEVEIAAGARLSPIQNRRGYGVLLAWCLILLCLISSASGAQIVLPACFAEYMVLQQAPQIPIWGWSDQPEGEVEFQGQITRWETKQPRKNGGQLLRWDCSIENVTNATGAPMIIRAGNRTGFFGGGDLIPATNVVLTNVNVGEVWLWAAKNPPGALKAELPPLEIQRLQKQVRVFKSRLDGVTNLSINGATPWKPCHTNTVGAAACYFVLQRANTLKIVPIGLIEVPHDDLIFALGKLPDGPPEKNNWRNLDDAGLRNAFSNANQSAFTLFNTAKNRHSRAVNQLKMLGTVTDAVLLRWEDMNDCNLTRLVAVWNLHPLSVRGTIW